MEKKVKTLSRKELVELFKRGKLPTDKNFEQLIYSNYNKADDKLDITDDRGVQMYPVKSGQLLNFFEHPDDEDPAYEVSISKEGLYIQRASNGTEESNASEQHPELFIEKSSGNIPIGHTEPKSKLDVDGIITSQGRLGNYKPNEGALNEISADGYWYNVFEKNLTNVHAFEFMAYARAKDNQGKYSILHAIVTCAFRKKGSRIRRTRSQFNRKDKIRIRVVSKPLLLEEGKSPTRDIGLLKRISRWWKIIRQDNENHYNIQLKTNRHYGNEDTKIRYKITLLWDPNTIGAQDQENGVKNDYEKLKEEVCSLVEDKEKEIAANTLLLEKLKDSKDLEILRKQETATIEKNKRSLSYLNELKKIINKSRDTLSKVKKHHRHKKDQQFNRETIDKLSSLEKKIEAALTEFKTEKSS